ncbi:MAG: DNA-directed RNA polymerase subunit alpha [Deltaproteobacteria bacterium]|nr:DNA-directed RNA polymerase subunit alpha [Deltaproteobacteria bacterium]MBW2305500.1 DNA-directed RNA polymerase subunit alpha [Deltaproteobacteria bacterium]
MYVKNWEGLMRPSGLTVDEDTHTHSYGKFVCAPLEKGFGITLGNALRRVLLSSICGAAITSVRIDGVLHEFSVVQGVVEDVTDIILNLKGVRVKLHGVESAKMRIDQDQEGDIFAGNIVTDHTTEILNPEHYIAHVSKGGHLKMEMEATMGRGYVTMDKHSGNNTPPGTIPVDSMHSPVQKVSYSVTPARVGQSLDYDTLTMEIWTDGSASPEDTLSYAAKIIQEHMSPFINFQEEPHHQALPAETEESVDMELVEKLSMKVDELELTVRSTNCLKNIGIQYIGELVTIKESDLLKTKNFGKKSLNEIKVMLEEQNLRLGMNVDELPQGVRDQLNLTLPAKLKKDGCVPDKE